MTEEGTIPPTQSAVGWLRTAELFAQQTDILRLAGLLDPSNRRTAMNHIFARITERHDAIALTFTPCAGMLYRWLLRQRPAGQQQEVEIAEFAAWTGTERPRPYCMKHIKNALRELIDAGLVEVVRQYTSKIFKLITWHPNQKKNSQSDPLTSSFEKTTSQKQTLNPDSSVATYREIQRTTDNPPSHPVVVTNYEQKEGKSTSAQTATAAFPSPQSPPIPPENGVEKPDSSPTNQPSSTPFLKGHEAETAQTKTPKVLEAVKAAGIGVNSRLASVVLHASAQTVEDALKLLQSRQQQDKVKNPAGFLIEAIRRGWKLPPPRHSNSGNSEQSTKRVPPEFNEWYTLAYQFGIVRGSTLVDGELCVYTDLEQWQPWRDMKALFSVQRLQKMLKQVENL